MDYPDDSLYSLLDTEERRRELTPDTTDPEEFFTTLLTACETSIPYGYDDVLGYIRERAEELGIPPEGLAESLSRRNHEALDKSGDAFDAVLQLIRQRTDFERKLIRENLERLELTPVEHILFGTGLDLMPVIDELFFKWKRAVPDVVKRTVQRTDKNRSEVAQMLLNRGLGDRYAVIVEAETGRPPEIYDEACTYEQMAYASFFAEESTEIARILGRGISELQAAAGTEKKMGNPEGAEDAKRWLAFLLAWTEAAVNTDRNRHEDLWKNVDEQWVLTSGRVILVHPMEEGYADPIRIMPEVRVLFQLDEAREMIHLIKGRMLDWEEGLYSGHELYPTFRESLENTHAGVFVTPLYSGEDYDFRFSGQIVPNRSDVRMRGTKIFMDSNSCRNNVEVYRKCAEKYFTGDFLRRYDELVRKETFLYYVIAHECGHSVLMGVDTKEKMGDCYRNVEEYKASHIGLEVLHTMVEALPERYLDSLCIFIVTRIVRFLGRGMRTDRTLEPYFNEAVIQLGTLMDERYLYFKDDRLHFDPENREGFFARILSINGKLKQLYLDQDWEGVRAFRKEHMVVDERVEALFAYLDGM